MVRDTNRAISNIGKEISLEEQRLDILQDIATNTGFDTKIFGELAESLRVDPGTTVRDAIEKIGNNLVDLSDDDRELYRNQISQLTSEIRSITEEGSQRRFQERALAGGFGQTIRDLFSRVQLDFDELGKAVGFIGKGQDIETIKRIFSGETSLVRALTQRDVQVGFGGRIDQASVRLAESSFSNAQQQLSVQEGTQGLISANNQEIQRLTDLLKPVSEFSLSEIQERIALSGRIRSLLGEDELSGDISKDVSRINQLESDIESSRAKNISDVSEINKLNIRIRQLEADLESRRIKNISELAKINELKSSIEGISDVSEINKLNIRIRQLEADLESRRIKNISDVSNINELNVRIRQLESGLESRRIKNISDVSEINKLNAEISKNVGLLEDIGQFGFKELGITPINSPSVSSILPRGESDPFANRQSKSSPQSPPVVNLSINGTDKSSDQIFQELKPFLIPFLNNDLISNEQGNFIGAF